MTATCIARAEEALLRALIAEREQALAAALRGTYHRRDQLDAMRAGIERLRRELTGAAS
jgi:hypothetical protein